MHIDLHSLSEEQAKKSVASTLQHASYETKIDKIRFVTGRGNHKNARGERGTLYEKFPDWLRDAKNQQLEVHQFDGFYEVDIRNNTFIRDPLQALCTEGIKLLLIKELPNIKKGAEANREDDLLALAFCYQRGVGVTQDYKKSAQIYQELAEKGNVLAQYETGCSYFIGRGVRQKDDIARRFLCMAAAQNYSLAQVLLGNIYWNGIGTAVDYTQAVLYYRAAADNGQAEGMCKLGCAYHDGHGVDPDFNQALKCWEHASELGDCVAAYNLSVIYRMNEFKDFNKVFVYLERAANLGDPDGMHVSSFCIFSWHKYYKKHPSCIAMVSRSSR